jgi:hypothetical protein
MRYRFGFLVVLATLGCSSTPSSGPTAGIPPGATPSATAVKNWKSRTDSTYLFKVKFPYGDPIERPVFFGNQPKGVQEGTDFAGEVYLKETGDQANVFAIRTARFRANVKAAEREETLTILTSNWPPAGFTKSEPKAVIWGGQQGTETTWTDPAGPTKWIVRQLSTPNALYIGYVRDLGKLTPADIVTFFDSFELLPKPS